MKSLAIIFAMAFGSVTAMKPPNIPHFDDFKKAESLWVANFKLFDIPPIFNEHISKLSPVGVDFVNNIIPNPIID